MNRSSNEIQFDQIKAKLNKIRKGKGKNLRGVRYPDSLKKQIVAAFHTGIKVRTLAS